MSEPTYTIEEVRQAYQFRKNGKPVFGTPRAIREGILKGLRKANDAALRAEYERSCNRNAFTRTFLDAVYPHMPDSANRKHFVFPEADSSPVDAVPAVDLRYTAKVVEASAQREMEKATGQSPFDRIRHVDHRGEWWDARELQGILGYQASWQNFENAIEKAKLSLKASDGAEADHFNDVIKMVPLGSGANRPVNTYRLSRHACHLVAQNGDPSKPEIAAAQRYFSVQTRRAELMDAGLSPIERTAHIDALVSGQQQLTAAVGEIGENLGSVEVKMLTAIEIMQQQFNQQLEALKGTITKAQTPAVADLKRLHGSLYQKVLEQSYRYPDGLHCPCCNKATTTWEIDHWRSKADPARTNGWKVCRPCNQALGAAGDSTKRDKYKNRFDAFQLRCDDYEQYLNGDEIKQLGLL